MGCTKNNEKSTGTKAKDSDANKNDETIALVIHRQDDDWSKSVADAFGDDVKDRGYNFVFENPNNDLETQISQIESLTVQGVDGIAIVPLDTDAVAPSLGSAMDSDISVVSSDPTPGINHIITSASYEAGE